MRSSSKEFRNQESMMEEAVSDILSVFVKGGLTQKGKGADAYAADPRVL